MPGSAERSDHPAVLGLLILAAATSSAAPPLIDSQGTLAKAIGTSDPEAVGIDRAAAERLVKAAEASKSDALIVIKDDRLVIDRRFGAPGPIEVMSVTKSVVSLAVGLLLDEGKLKSLDEPVYRWFPQWKSGDFSAITVWQLMTHASGLDHESFAAPLYRAKDSLSVPLGRKLKMFPGQMFSYNNESTQLLSRIVAESAKEPIDRYLDERIFRPLGFSHWTWARDGAGNVRTFSDLALEPGDLAKLGLLLLHHGLAGERRLISEHWVNDSTRPSPRFDHYGLLWWIRRPPPGVAQTKTQREKLERAGFSAAEKLQPLDDRLFDQETAYWLEVGARLSPDERAQLAKLDRRGVSAFVSTAQPAIGYYADGWLGQYLVVYPAERMVVVRLRRSTENNDDAENQRWGFHELFTLSEALTERRPAVVEPGPPPEKAAISRAGLRSILADLAPQSPGAVLLPSLQSGALIGLRLFHVQRGSPYEAIGLHEGDLLRTIDGERVLDDRQLGTALSRLEQRAVVLEIERHGKRHLLSLQLE